MVGAFTMGTLLRRFPRDLRNNLGKYLGIFLLLVVSIALVAGFLSAASSISKIIEDMPDKYTIEDGQFSTSFKANDKAIDAVEELGCTVYESFNMDLPAVKSKSDSSEETDFTLRIYNNRTEVNLAAYCEGNQPSASDEIAVDRVFASNAGISVGDTIEVAGKTMTVSGIMTMPDYQALFEKNSDFVFNALTFTVAEVSPEVFDDFAQDNSVTYTYSFVTDNRSMALSDRVDMEKDMVTALSDNNVAISSLIDSSNNQGIGYPADDIEGDSSMWETLMFLLIIIMAFVFVVLTSATIEEESSVIGTLMSMGFKKGEILLYYMTLPTFVGLLGAVFGNVLGYTLMADPMKDLYYNSYSLPPYAATWDWYVFIITTVVPVVLLIVITFIGLLRKLRFSPLQFLRHELGRGGTRRGVKLPSFLGFSSRFRIRVFLRNLPHFATLFVGVGFASMLLLFGLSVMPTMDNYANSLKNTMVAQYQYTLKSPLELNGTDDQRDAYAAAEKLTETEDLSDLPLAELMDLMSKASTIDEDATPINTLSNDQGAIDQAEKYAVYSLKIDRPGDAGQEEVAVYGIEDDSRYFNEDVSNGKTVVGFGLADKLGLDTGETYKFFDEYTDKTYQLTVDDIEGEETAMCVWLSLDSFNEMFDNDSDYFNAYASNEPLDIEGAYLASELTPADMDKIGNQMTNSMGDMMNMLVAVSVMIYLILMYLLTKTVIDRSARSISYMKVFGYRNGEIDRLYLTPITETVVVSLIATIPILIAALTALFKSMLMDMNGNIPIYVPFSAMATVVIVGFLVYLVVAFLHARSIKKVPLSLALKVQE